MARGSYRNAWPCYVATSPCVGPGQVPTPGGMFPLASTGGATQTKSQAGVTGNACCVVVGGGWRQPSILHMQQT